MRDAADVPCEAANDPFMLRRDTRATTPKVPTMNRSSAQIALLACFVLPLAACGQQGAAGGGASARADDSPEYQAFQFRDGVMHSLAWKVGKLRAMAVGDIPVDNAIALKNARDTAALAGMFADGFIPNSAVKGSRRVARDLDELPGLPAKGRRSANGGHGARRCGSSERLRGGEGHGASRRPVLRRLPPAVPQTRDATGSGRRARTGRYCNVPLR